MEHTPLLHDAAAAAADAATLGNTPLARFLAASQGLALLWLVPAAWLTAGLRAVAGEAAAPVLWILGAVWLTAAGTRALKPARAAAWAADALRVQAAVAAVAALLCAALAQLWAAGFLLWAFLVCAAASHLWLQNKPLTLPPTPSMLARCSLGLAFLVGHALLPLLMMHSLSKLAVQQEYPPQGTFVETHYSPQVLIECKGSGSPTIVFETGLGALRNSSFHMLYAPLENSTRVCWYDRPGYGYSQPVLFQSHQSIQVVSDNLWAVLEAAGEQGPFVLVGHSIAGLYTRNFVMDHAQNVSGLMLIDTSSEYQGGYEKHWGEQVLAEIANLVSPLIPNVNAFFALFGGNMDYRKEDAVHILNDWWAKTVLSELRGAFFGEFPAAFVKKRRGIVESDGHDGRLFGDIPMTLLTAGKSAGELCHSFELDPCSTLKDLPQKGRITTEGGKSFVYVNNTIPDGWGIGWLGWHHQQITESSDNVWEIFVNGTHFVMQDYSQESLERLQQLVKRSRVYWDGKRNH